MNRGRVCFSSATLSRPYASTSCASPACFKVKSSERRQIDLRVLNLDSVGEVINRLPDLVFGFKGCLATSNERVTL